MVPTQMATEDAVPLPAASSLPSSEPDASPTTQQFHERPSPFYEKTKKHLLLVVPRHDIFVRMTMLIEESAADEYIIDWAATIDLESHW